MNNLTVVKSNKIIEASYKLSKYEQLLILLAISKVDSKKELKISDIFEVNAKEISSTFDIHPKEAYNLMKKASESLLGKTVRIDKPDINGTYTLSSWLSYCTYIPSEGTLKIKFAEKIIPLLSQLKGNFTQYKLGEISGFKSVYGIRLYEFILQWKNKNKRSFTVSELRERFQLKKNQYKVFSKFRIGCIESAVKDINEHSSYTVTKVNYIKSGRSISSIEFEYSLKSKLEKEKENDRNSLVFGSMLNDLNNVPTRELPFQ